MSPQQEYLLRELIAADRAYHTAVKSGKTPIGQDRTDRGVEIGSINGVARSTAQSLIDAGLAELVDVGRMNDYLFLGSYEPYDEE